MTNRKIILASQSKQRYKLFKTLNLPFVVQPADIDEHVIKASAEAKRAELVAIAKAKEVIKKNKKAIVVAADTYGLLEDQVLEKPTSKEKAIKMLKLLSNKEFLALTGFCYLDPVNKISYSTTKQVKTKFRDLSIEEIEFYVESEPVLTWSASFSPAYDSGMALIETIQGSFTAFTHGLPIEDLTRLLRKSGVYE
ncbi:MAG: Maf family protein [Patescibacteria group bacterium]|nr:Maf family protein [Patescibacteria group bacterium]